MNTLIECMRWYGANDPVSLRDVRQCGAAGVFTALHDIPYGEIWTREAIAERKALLAEHALVWAAVESVPVSEAIKTRTGDYERHLDNYCQTLRNLGAEGVNVVIYNFMPVLDWVRTDLAYTLEDGAQCLKFDPVQFAAFELFLLKRPGADQDYSPEQLTRAEDFFHAMSVDEQKQFEQKIIDVFPGCKMGLTIDKLREMLASYAEIDAAKLKEHLRLFLEAVVPTADEAGVRLAIHPDDPPFPILGLPRIVSTESDVRDLLGFHDSAANGLCFCSGSFGGRRDNDLAGMVERHGARVNAVHLRSVQHNPDGSFYEARHLEGCANLPHLVSLFLAEQKRRRTAGRTDWRLPMRPDHGHRILDDLTKAENPNPGYDCIGRMRGLAELRGVQAALNLS